MSECYIDVPITMGSSGERVVRGRIVDVAPHLASVSTWVVHPSESEVGLYNVTNVETGFRITGSIAQTELDAIFAARIVLSTKTAAEIVGHLRDCALILKRQGYIGFESVK